MGIGDWFRRQEEPPLKELGLKQERFRFVLHFQARRYR